MIFQRSMAWTSAREKHNMSNFASRVKRTAPQFSIENHSATNAGANPHGQQIAAIFTRAQSAFAKRRHIHIVVHHHGHVQLL